MSRRTLRPELFIDAAEMVDSGAHHFACHALRQASRTPTEGREAIAQFTAVFLTPENRWFFYGSRAPFFGSEFRVGPHESFETAKDRTRDEDRAHRVLALLLCAELARRAQFRRKLQFRRLKSGEILRRGDEWRSLFFGQDWKKTTFQGHRVTSVGRYRRRVRSAKNGGLL